MPDVEREPSRRSGVSSPTGYRCTCTRSSTGTLSITASKTPWSTRAGELSLPAAAGRVSGGPTVELATHSLHANLPVAGESRLSSTSAILPAPLKSISINKKHWSSSIFIRRSAIRQFGSRELILIHQNREHWFETRRAESGIPRRFAAVLYTVTVLHGRSSGILDTGRDPYPREMSHRGTTAILVWRLRRVTETGSESTGACGLQNVSETGSESSGACGGVAPELCMAQRLSQPRVRSGIHECTVRSHVSQSNVPIQSAAVHSTLHCARLRAAPRARAPRACVTNALEILRYVACTDGTMMRGALSLLLVCYSCCLLLVNVIGGASAQAAPGNNPQRNVNRWGTVPDQPSCGDPALECESEEGGSCQVRLPPPDQTAATYSVWWQQTKAWSDRRKADLATRPFADRSAYDQPELQWAQRNFVQPQVVRGRPGRLRRQPLPPRSVRAPTHRRDTRTLCCADGARPLPVRPYHQPVDRGPLPRRPARAIRGDRLGSSVDRLHEPWRR